MSATARVFMSARSEKLHELLCLMRPQTATHAVALAKKICDILEWDGRKEPKGMCMTARPAVFNYCEEHRLPVLWSETRVRVPAQPGLGVGTVVDAGLANKIVVEFDEDDGEGGRTRLEFSVLDLEVVL